MSALIAGTQLSALAGAAPMGIAGGLGYGFGIRYGFEKLFPAFQEGGVQQAIGLLQSDISELISSIINLDGIDSTPQPQQGGSIARGSNAPTQASELGLVVPARDDPVSQPVHGPVAPVANIPTPTGVVDLQPQVRLEIRDPRTGKLLIGTTRTESQHAELIKRMDQQVQNLVRSGNDSTAIGRRRVLELSQYRIAFHEEFGYWV
jgi:hypothetical protein